MQAVYTEEQVLCKRYGREGGGLYIAYSKAKSIKICKEFSLDRNRVLSKEQRNPPLTVAFIT